MKEQTLPRIVNIDSKLVVGIYRRMSLIDNQTAELWKSFMPRRAEVHSRLNDDLISMQIYDEKMIIGDLSQSFVKWACIEVSEGNAVPPDMHSYEIKGGLYAVFDYKGKSNDASIFMYIFGEWLPDSMYDLDHRPHFEILGDRYNNKDSSSEEEIWIPVLPKSQTT